MENIVIKNYDKKIEIRKLTNEELERLSPQATLEYRHQLQQNQQGSQKRKPKAVAQEMLNAFRVELRGAKELLEKENKSPEEKRVDLANIEKALDDISRLTPSHWV